MPYFKCVPCKVRVSAAGADSSPTDGSCPSCGSALEPVAQLTELVGFRSPDVFDSTIAPRVDRPVRDITGGRAAVEAQLDSDRWLDEGGSLGPELLAKAIALAIPPRT